MKEISSERWQVLFKFKILESWNPEPSILDFFFWKTDPDEFNTYSNPDSKVNLFKQTKSPPLYEPDYPI